MLQACSRLFHHGTLVCERFVAEDVIARFEPGRHDKVPFVSRVFEFVPGPVSCSGVVQLPAVDRSIWVGVDKAFAVNLVERELCFIRLGAVAGATGEIV